MRGTGRFACCSLLSWVRLGEGGVCGLYGVSFSRLIASGKTGILILVPGCCFLLSLFLGTCLLCGRLSWFSAPIALVQCPINRFLRGTTRAIFFINLHLIPSSLGCLLTCWLFATRLLAYQYRPAPRPARIDTVGGEFMAAIRLTGGGDVLFASCYNGWRRGGGGAAMSLLA